MRGYAGGINRGDKSLMRGYARGFNRGDKSLMTKVRISMS